MISDEIRGGLSELGLDAEEMIDKFDSEERFLRYYVKFFEAAGGVVEQLAAAVAGGDLTQTERSAHALKGLAGNIGLGGVYEPAKKIVDDLRAGNTAEYKSDFDGCYNVYAAAYEISKRI